MLTIYRFFTSIFIIFAPYYLKYRLLKGKEDQIRFREKLSITNQSRGNGCLIWFHAASVGEAMSILPLIENLEKEKKINTILITTITLSSGQILEKKFFKNKKIIHQFLPLDIPKLMDKFLNHWSPNLSILIDSEIWPNLIFNVKKRNIPLLLINGRITNKTFLRWNSFKNFSKKIFEKFDLCVVSNKETENYLKTLGAKNIKNYGNLKFAKTKLDLNNQLNPDLSYKIKDRKIWCAASTHPTEEIFCAKVHLALKKTHKNILTIIIPRHIDRIEKISDELIKANLKISLYSNFKEINDNTDILLIDTYGETSKFYQISKCVFLGKSLISSLKKDSGQNPIEASRVGCKIYHGPNVTNFVEIYSYLKSLGTTFEVNSHEELSQYLVDELKEDKIVNKDVIQKIENFGTNILTNVLNEIKIYINK